MCSFRSERIDPLKNILYELYLVPLEKAETKFFSSLNLIDLKKPFGINQEYLNIPCRVSSEVNRVQTVVCVNDPKTETIGVRIWQDGVWERNILKLVMDFLETCKDCLFLDLGANIGQFTMLAAQLGRDVVAVEPFYDNVMRIHKSVGLANLQDRVKLVKNALFNKRHELKRLSRFDTNKGGQL